MEDDNEFISRREFDLVTSAYQREIDLTTKAHATEHKMLAEALTKADSELSRRLEGMNEFREQLEKQAGAFLTRELFDQYTKEQGQRIELALQANTEKYDAIMNAIVNKHDSDVEGLKQQVQTERENRKTFEGSMNTWKWIATFLGASGVGGVIIILIANAKVLSP